MVLLHNCESTSRTTTALLPATLLFLITITALALPLPRQATAAGPQDEAAREEQDSGAARPVEDASVTGTPVDGTRADAAADNIISVDLGLLDAIMTALENNLNIQAERLRAETSVLDVMASRGIFDPVLFSSGSHTDFEEPTSSQLDTGDTEISEVTGKRSTFELGLRNRFLTGMTSELRFDQTRSLDDRAFQLLNPAYRSNLGLTLTQPLLRGGGVDVTLHDIRIAKTNVLITNEQFRQSVEDIVFQVIEAYWNLSFAEQDIRVKEESLTLAENEVRITENKVRLGLWAQLELDQALTEQYSRRADLVLAIKLFEDNLDSLRRLLYPLENNSDWDLLVRTTDQLKAAELDDDESWLDNQTIPDWGDNYAEALESRPEILQARLELRNRELEIMRGKNETLPTLDLSGSYTWAQLSDNFEDNVKDIWFPDPRTWTASLSFEYPLGDRTARAQLAKARIERRRSTLLLKEQENQVAGEVREASRAIESAIEQIRFSHRAFISAQKQLSAAASRRESGFLTNFEVLQFQRDLAEADQARNDAWRQYRLAQARSERAKGSLLRRVGIELDIDGSVIDSAGTRADDASD